MKTIDQSRVSCGEFRPKFAAATPFYVEGCMIMLCVGGEATFTIDFKSQTMRLGDVAFLFSDNVVELGTHSEAFAVRYVSLSAEECVAVYLNVISSTFWDGLYQRPIRPKDFEHPIDIEAWLSDMIRIRQSCGPKLAEKLISSMVQTYLMAMEGVVVHASEEPPPSAEAEQWRIMVEFLNLLARHYSREHSVKFYADALSVTPDYLLVVCKQTAELSPKELIEQKIVLAAKALLANTMLPIKTIADRLNYVDTSHLCKAFRRHVGVSPGEYRRQQR